MSYENAAQTLDQMELTNQTYAEAILHTGATMSPPQDIESSLPPAPAFNSKLLPQPIAEWVLDEADRMNCAPDYIAASLIVSLGSALGARCAMKPKRYDDWIVTPNLYGGIVGEPSSKKSPAASAATRFLNLLEAKEAQTHKDNMTTYEAEMAAYDAQQQAIKANMKKAATGKKSADSMTAAIHDLKSLEPPEEPVQRRFIVNDSTVAKLGDLLVNNPQGLLVFRDELVGLLSSWDKEGSEGDRAFYLEGWNGTGSFTIDRVQRGSLFIQNLCLSILGGIQPELLERYLSEMSNSLDNDGRFQRFQMLVYPEAVGWKWTDRYPIKEAREYVRGVFEHLAYADFTQIGAYPATDYIKMPHFIFSEEALSLFIQWSEELNTVLIPQEDNPLMRQHYGKFEKLFCALALILHLSNGDTGDISRGAAIRAAAWCEYLAGHAKRVYGLIETSRVKTAKALGRKIKEGKMHDHFTARDVQRKQWSGLATILQVESALDILESFEWLKGYTADIGTNGGRPTTKYVINPILGGRKS